MRERPQFRGVYALGARTRLSFPPWAGFANGSDSCGLLSLSLLSQSPVTFVSYPTSSLDTLGLVHPIPSLHHHSTCPHPPFTQSVFSTFPSVLQHSK